MDPYAGSWLTSSGRPFEGDFVANDRGLIERWSDDPRSTLEQFRHAANSSALTGAFQCTRRGILELHGSDIGTFDLASWHLADNSIREQYQNVAQWTESSMTTAHFSAVIRPVHPEYYFGDMSTSSAQRERTVISTVMRVDPLLSLWPSRSDRRDALAAAVEVDPGDAHSWRAFITALFDRAEQGGAVGTKQLQAYTRNLAFDSRSDGEVRFRGDLDESDIVAFQDWVINECARQAHERALTHQVHVGTHNLANSSPLPLEHLARRFPMMNLVMIHCWPFLREAGYLAKFVPNIYIDTCWLPVLSPQFMRDALETWVNYVPLHKLMLGHDTTSVEMAVGSAKFTRKILSEVLTYQRDALQLPDDVVIEYAADMLHGNASRIYAEK